MTTKQEIQEAVERIMENGIDGIVTAVAERTADELAKAGVDCESEDSIQHCLLMGIRAAMRDLYLAREHFSTAAIVAGKAELERAALKAYDNDNEAAVTFLKMTKQAVMAPPKQQKQKQPEQAKPVNDLERRDTVRCSAPKETMTLTLDTVMKKFVRKSVDVPALAGTIFTEVFASNVDPCVRKNILLHTEERVRTYFCDMLKDGATTDEMHEALMRAEAWIRDRKANAQKKHGAPHLQVVQKEQMKQSAA